MLDCGHKVEPERLELLNEFLDKRNAVRIDKHTLIAVLTYIKELELLSEQDNETDEYLDAFVALGGEPNKEGTISKELLIQIIKCEFELTIDMEEYLRKIGGETENINYY